MTAKPEKQFSTYLAPAINPDGTPSGDQVELGRGDENNPKSNVHYAFASTPTPTGAEHEAIVGALGEATEGAPITRQNGAKVLARAVELARSSENHTH